MKKILVNLYNWDQKGSGCVVVMISEQTDCHWTYHGNEPFTFIPDTQEQYDEVIELLNEFQMSYTEK